MSISESGGLPPDDGPSRDFDALLAYLGRSRSFDFTGYKRNSLRRRVDKRMQAIGAVGYVPYVDYLEVHPEEFGLLFDTILINVTGFFRDPPAWEALRTDVLPRLLEAKGPTEAVRFWCAGCASGEEAYSLAITLAERLGPEAFRDRVKIYATDVDEEALGRARLAVYDAREAQGIPPELLEKYFEPIDGRFAFQKDFRRAVIFGRHDLIQDAPISRIDVLSCRNTLMYFNSETQGRILERFHFALNERGALFLGKAETSMAHTNLFTPADLKHRIFAKVNHGRDRNHAAARAPEAEGLAPSSDFGRLRTAAFEADPVAHVVIDFAGALALANARARSLFGLAPADLGRPLKDLQFSYRPADLRSCLDHAYDRRLPVILKDVEWAVAEKSTIYLDIQAVPLYGPDSALLGASVTFADESAAKRMRDELSRTHRELETAYEELQSTNEEMETTNEELQSTVEELETTNEELQSTNEELETMNEELQSTNEELEALNEELRRRGVEYDQVNDFLGSVLESLRGGVAVVDPDLLIRAWNAKAEDLWGLRIGEVLGKNLLNLDIGLPVHELKATIKSCLSGLSPVGELTVAATTRRGKAFRCKVTCTPMGSGEAIRGAILMMDDAEDRAP